MINATLQCGRRRLSLDQPGVNGILNVTPDSFSDGGRFSALDAALRHAEAMVAAGAVIVDVGGESTRPGAAQVSGQEELDRVLPVIEAIDARLDVVISVDTSKPAVIAAAAAAGAGLINDVRALTEPDALSTAVATGLPVCLMHMRGSPATMQQSPAYREVVGEVRDFLVERRRACIEAGMPAGQIVLDPGFGFGKTLEHNLDLLLQLETLCAEAPVLVGLSRKRMVGELLGDADADADRTLGSVVASLLCVQHGASLVRVHDVAPMVQALRVWQGVKNRAPTAD